MKVIYCVVCKTSHTDERKRDGRPGYVRCPHCDRGTLHRELTPEAMGRVLAARADRWSEGR